jgi:hypothetical protein
LLRRVQRRGARRRRVAVGLGLALRGVELRLQRRQLARAGGRLGLGGGEGVAARSKFEFPWRQLVRSQHVI